MRGRGTTLLVAGLVLLAGMAAADALRDVGGGGDPAPASTPLAVEGVETAAAPDPRRRLADAGVEGVLYATAALDAGCEFQAVGLPELQTTRVFLAPGCRFDVSPDERHVVFGSPCPADRVVVHALVAGPSWQHVGCSPAWRPDGVLTYVHDGDVVTARGLRCVDARGAGCSRVVLAGSALSRALRPFFDAVAVRGFLVREIDWFTPDRLVAVVAARPTDEQFVITLERGRLVAPPRVFSPAFTHLRVLPERREAVVASATGFDVVRPDGDFRTSRASPGARALAYAPDETSYAVAEADDVCFHDASPGGAMFACVPLVAADIEWR